VEAEVSGTEITLKTDHAQKTLYRLTSWAEEHRIALEGLTVTRPSLDDVFLELTAEDAP
jgi:ABC-2 type transport system ATP-binding protein